MVNAPTSFKGGTLVPVPWFALVPLMTNAGGQISIPGIGGGVGPISVYIQFALVDPAQAQGIGLSNAVRMDFLP